jgi:hypothetical protein
MLQINVAVHLEQMLWRKNMAVFIFREVVQKTVH